MSNLFVNKTAVAEKMDIPGFDGRYYVKNDGTVWHAKENGNDKRLRGHRGKNAPRSRKYRLFRADGTNRSVYMNVIMKQTYFKDKVPDGYCLMHLNGMEEDWSVWNLKPISRVELGKIRHRSNDAKSVIKRDPKTWKIVGVFSSASEASKSATCGIQSILNACNHKLKKRPGIAADGYFYQWED